MHDQFVLPVNTVEVKGAIFYMHSYEALGPNGF